MITVAVDPGLTGAVAVFRDKNLLTVTRSRVTMLKTRKIVDPYWLVNYLINCNTDRVVIEHVGPSPPMGVVGAFSFGMSFAMAIGVSEGACLPWDTVTPQYWKGYHGLLKKPKDAARKLVIEKYPKLVDKFKHKNSVDLADAILMGLAYIKG